MTTDEDAWLDEVRWNRDGLVPVIAQDHQSGTVLMLAWMNEEALLQTIATGEGIYWSRSRQRLWHKGESSGHVQKIKAIQLDCDGDTIILQVEQIGGIACHTGRQHCFFRRLEGNRWVETEPVLRDPNLIYGRQGGSK